MMTVLQYELRCEISSSRTFPGTISAASDLFTSRISTRLRRSTSFFFSLISSFPGLKVVNKPSTINFMYGKLIVGSVVAQSRTLKLYFNLSGYTMEDPNKLLENCGKIGHHGVGNYRITFADKEHFDDIKDFMIQCRRYYK